MKFRCERDVLFDALQTAGRAVASRGTALPVLSGVRVEVVGDDLLLAGTDLDLAIQARATVAGVADGVTVVPARLVAEIVRALEPGAVSVETDDEELRITAGRSQFAVRTLVVPAVITTTTPSDSLSTTCHFPGSPVIGKQASRSPQNRGRGGPLQFPRQPSDRSTPSAPEGPSGPAPGSQVPSMAFALTRQARLPLVSA